jgi:hypothetical protein
MDDSDERRRHALVGSVGRVNKAPIKPHISVSYAVMRVWYLF